MLRVFILILALCSFSVSQSADTLFYKEYKYELLKARKLYLELEDSIKTQCEKYKTDKDLLSAIIFPELVRYSSFRDFFETGVLEALYVEKGSEAANFSIGKFQMKPSFIEDLEKQVREYPEKLKPFQSIIEFDSHGTYDIRKERIQRLKSEYWQITYLNCFYHVVRLKFQGISFENDEDKVRFFASAYNHGFNCNKEEIITWSKKKCFPDGCGYTERRQYCYTDIAVRFYKFLKR